MRKINSLQLFLLIALLLAVLGYSNIKLINLDVLILNSISERIAHNEVEKLIKAQQKWGWVGYAIIPIVILLRSSLVALCLSIGMFFYNMNHTFKFKQFFKIALVGEFILVLVGYFKLGYFYFIKTDYTLQDIQQYYPLSYINFLNLEKIQPWLVYPLQTINLFEIAYFFVLVYGLWKLLKNKFSKSFEIVAVSYGSGLVIWLGLVMFLTLNMT